MILYALEVARGLGEVEIVYTRCEPDPTTSSDTFTMSEGNSEVHIREQCIPYYIQQSRFRENSNEANLRQNCM